MYEQLKSQQLALPEQDVTISFSPLRDQVIHLEDQEVPFEHAALVKRNWFADV